MVFIFLYFINLFSASTYCIGIEILFLATPLIVNDSELYVTDK